MSVAMEPETGFGPRASADGRPVKLAMQELRLGGVVTPIGARLQVRHVFVSGERRPLEAVYAFALPRDTALRRFHITAEGFSVHSELQPAAEAQETYEAAMQEGRLTALSRVYGDGMVNLTVGNIRPGERVAVELELAAGVESRDDGFRFRFPFAAAPGYHMKAHYTEDGEIELLDERFGDVILPVWSRNAEELHRVSFDLEVQMSEALKEVSSPSHRIRVFPGDGGAARVALATDADAPNRDLILDARTREGRCAVFAGTDAAGKGRFAALIPSGSFGDATAAPRRVVFLIDRSGSMGGEPMRQAKAAVEACLGGLSPGDRFGVVAFDDYAESASDALLAVDETGRETVRGFLRGVDARGGTELFAGIEAAAAMLQPDGGDILLATDGQVYATEDIIAGARGNGVRIHCLGIGSASHDRFLSLLARETGGVSRSVTARERVDLAAMELFAAIGRPAAADVRYEVEGIKGAALAPQPTGAVFAGAPAVVMGSCVGPGTGVLRARWTEQGQPRAFEASIVVPEGGMGETLRLLQGARLLTDADMQATPHAGSRALSKRAKERHEKRLEALSREYELASRAMALIAVVERAGDAAGDLPETHVVRVGMPEDTDFDAYFGPAAPVSRRAPRYSEGPPCYAAFEPAEFVQSRCESPESELGAMLEDAAYAPVDDDQSVDLLMALAGAIEPDGGMPGDDDEERLFATAFAMAVFVSEGNTFAHGAFAAHVSRLAEYLRGRDLAGCGPGPEAVVELLLDWAEQRVQVDAMFDELASVWTLGEPMTSDHWDRLLASLKQRNA